MRMCNEYRSFYYIRSSIAKSNLPNLAHEAGVGLIVDFFEILFL